MGDKVTMAVMIAERFHRRRGGMHPNPGRPSVVFDEASADQGYLVPLHEH